MVVRKHYYVSGRVQGVGFRYRAYHIAKKFGLTGYAINLDDGRVEMEVQGEEALVDDLLRRMDQGTFIHIDGVESRRMEVDSSERSFYTD